MTPPTTTMPPSPLPLVLQIGFAGARTLVDTKAHPTADPAAFSAAAETALLELLQSLPGELGLGGAPVFFCGISQIAIGGDMAFARALHQHGSLHRVFLPQPLDGYLAASGSRGPDFTDAQQAQARALLEQPGTIQTRVVSDAAGRHERFRETNLEIARVSDVVICLERARQDGRAGGTLELADLARRRKRPVITLEIGVGQDGQPAITRPKEAAEDVALRSLPPPRLPDGLSSAGIKPLRFPPLPAGSDYVKALKDANSDQANRLRSLFKWAALIIVIGHVLATMLAVVALNVHDGVAVILATELLLLGLGLSVHHQLHRSRSLGRWAACRLAAEVGRSLQALGQLPVYLQHFFTLPLPVEFLPLLRTLSVMHLRDTARAGTADWVSARNEYVRNRLVDPTKHAQIPYHDDSRAKAGRWRARANATFYVASIGALLAATLKLLTLAHSVPVPPHLETAVTAVLGSLAIVLPVVAVAALSLAAAFDLEAKEHTSSEMFAFLQEQKALLEGAQSPSEVSRLVIETESRLLGETANWYARRSFVGVA